METVANRIVEYLDKNKTIWNDADRMRMVLGFEVIFHNIMMIGPILVAAKFIGIFLEAVILLTAYGTLKMSAGGIHFKKSSVCLIGTGIFVGLGVICSRYINLDLVSVVLIYFICLIVLIIVGPQGTKNNPISEENLGKMRKRTIYFVLLYLTLTVVMANCIGVIPYLLFIAVVFETLSILPTYIKNRSL